MAGLTGLEPATSCVTGRHSNQLSYNPIQPPTGATDIEVYHKGCPLGIAGLTIVIEHASWRQQAPTALPCHPCQRPSCTTHQPPLGPS